MGGSVPFQDALAQRLGVMALSRSQLEQFLAQHPPRLSPGGSHEAACLGCSAMPRTWPLLCCCAASLALLYFHCMQSISAHGAALAAAWRVV